MNLYLICDLDSTDRDSKAEGPDAGAAQRPDQAPLAHQHRVH